MIRDICFTDEWLNHFKEQEEYRRIDKIILEKMIYALHLLECLVSNGLDFVFKGGTSLVLLLEEDNRFSIDLDIICKIHRKELEEILNNVLDLSYFTKWELEEHRSYQPGIPKAHYKFSFETSMQGSGTILMDVLLEDSVYPELVELPIETKWIETDGRTLISMPSIDSIMGDKLSAFAPNTIGIPYFKGKDKQSSSMEICKQLFDLSRLFENINDMEIVAASFDAIVNQEIKFRSGEDPDKELTPDIVLHDTIATCVILAKRGGGSDSEKAKYKKLQKGIRAFGSGYLMTGHFRIDDAVPASSRVAYLAAKLLTNDLSPIIYFEGQDIFDLLVEDQKWNFLNRLKRHPDKSSFYYWYKAVELLTRN